MTHKSTISEKITMDSELKNIHFRRALIIQDFAIVEMAMNHLICLHFLNKPNDIKFISDFLENEYFSFQLRKKLFELAFRQRYPSIEFPWNSLQKIQHLRNIIAHSRISEENLMDGQGRVIKKSEKHSICLIRKKEMHYQCMKNLNVTWTELCCHSLVSKTIYKCNSRLNQLLKFGKRLTLKSFGI
jgi:hypothetical protein